MSTNELPVVIFVDHNERMLTAFVEEVAHQHGGPDNNRFGNYYRFAKEIVNLSPDVTGNRQQLDEVASEIAGRYMGANYPIAILCDVYLFHEFDDHKSGPRLAEALRSAFPQVPVWAYTKDQWKVETVYFCSTCAIDGMLYLGNLQKQANNLWNLFVNGRDLQARTTSASLESLFSTPSWFSVEWVSPVESCHTYGLKAATESLSYQMFGGNPDVNRLRLRQISPGFSGTQLVKATCVDTDGNPLSNEWVMKIAEHEDEIQKLRDELEGYRKVSERIPHDFRPELYRIGSQSPCCILPGWWACFAMSFEGDYSPLIDVFDTVTPEDVYYRVLRHCLPKLYGEPQLREGNRELPSDRAIAAARKGLEDDERFAALIEEHRPDFAADRQTIAERVEELRTNIQANDTFPGRCCRYVHGDLNCRNIMVNDDTPASFRLIDFPKVAADEAPLAATDFAKAETELFFLIMDRRSGKEIAPARIAEWLPISIAATQALQFDDLNLTDGHLARVCRCVHAIRRAYAEAVGTGEADWLQYRIVLLETVLRYLNYNDVAPVKRALAAVYALSLIESMNQPGSERNCLVPS